MYLVSEFPKDEQKRSQANTALAIPFQGKILHPCTWQIFWFRWGEYTFDIREVRAKFGAKEVKAIDTEFKTNLCTKFSKQMKEVIDLVGDKPFEDILKS